MKRTPPVPALLTDERIDTISFDDLRSAYRELAAHHEEMRRKLKENTADALREMREQGKATGEPPYGFRVARGKLKPKRDEQRVIDRVKAMRAEGLTTYMIAKTLNDSGIEPREGAKFWPIQIQRILDALDAGARPDRTIEDSGGDSVHIPKDLADSGRA